MNPLSVFKNMPKVGIRPTIDGRLGGVRESLEEQTMNQAKSVALLIQKNLRYPNGEPVECVLADTCIGGVAEASATAEKFQKETLVHCTYENFDLPNLTQFETVLRTPQLKGMNVTIPYKQEVMPFLDGLDEVSQAIGAVNTIVFNKDGTTTGYNTDYIGFQKSIVSLITSQIKAALVLGTGGSSKAVVYALHKMGITPQYVSRKKGID